MCGIIQLPYYNSGKDDGAQAARQFLAGDGYQTIPDLASAAATHRVETHALIASSAQNLSYDNMQHYKAGFVTGYQGTILAAICQQAEISEAATLAL